jgi:hypothetical protein
MRFSRRRLVIVSSGGRRGRVLVSAENWAKVKRIFLSVVDIPALERAAASSVRAVATLRSARKSNPCWRRMTMRTA